MKETINEFKKFALRGNVIDLAVGIVIGAAFHAIITAFVGNVIMPLLGMITGGNNLASLHVTFKSATITYGVFLQAVLDFILVAFAIFMAVKAINRFKKKEEAAAPAAPPKQEVLLEEIRDILKNK